MSAARAPAGLYLHHAPAPAALDRRPPAWMRRLVRTGRARWLPPGAAEDAPPTEAPGDARAVILSNPAYTPDLAALVETARARGTRIVGAYESADFDLGLWADGRLRGHPDATQGALLRHVRDLARAVALCDAFLVTGPAMAARLAARAPGTTCLALPLVPEAAGRPPLPGLRPGWAPPPGARRIVVEATDATDRTALLPQAARLALAAERTGARLVIGADVILPDALRDHPALDIVPAGRPLPMAPGTVAVWPSDGAADWTAARSGAAMARALVAGATGWGAVPEQIAASAAPAHRCVPLRDDWGEDLHEIFTAPLRQDWPRRIRDEYRWRQSLSPARQDAALAGMLAQILPADGAPR
ncbi:hypothetical protein ROJ8625_01546 [Roseivivax jejudonensis]|uniref:Uncharacterized protein n=1 Tax=Roseivivax jejudonensis TaxID=1529041 RepID=A0A1X6YWV3_9RHOB|nr:hypothetical protein [Roseivivax jejudonensis]SLN33128.1 hypothetical protein ROJ8625_01546 [Roseivivax jejudonensis]